MGKKTLKSFKWMLLFLVVIIALTNIISKGISIYHLNRIEWDFSSYSISATLIIFIGSLAYVSLSFVEHFLYKKKMKDIEHVVVLFIGIIGLLYSGFIGFMQLYHGGG